MQRIERVCVACILPQQVNHSLVAVLLVFPDCCVKYLVLSNGFLLIKRMLWPELARRQPTRRNAWHVRRIVPHLRPSTVLGCLLHHLFEVGHTLRRRLLRDRRRGDLGTGGLW